MKLFGFLLRLVLVVGLIVWLADRPGTAQIEWRDFVIETSAAVLVLIVLAIAYALLTLQRIWRFLLDGPRFWKLKRKLGKMEEGQLALSKGLAAIAAGLGAEASKQAVKARKLLGETPVTQLILAQAAHLTGDAKTARALFQAMTLNKDTAVLGYRGLIMAALREGQFDEASRQAQLLEAVDNNVPWLHLVRFETAARFENWTAASGYLEKARKGKALPARVADCQEAALLLADAKYALRESQGKKALERAERAKRLMPDWLPATLVLAEALIVTDHRRTALRAIERAWARQPNRHLLPLALWAALPAKPLDAMKLVERMTQSTRDHYASRMALAETALNADLWGEARRHLMKLVTTDVATNQTYQLLARLEQKENHNELAAAQWLAKGVAAPADAAWLCSACGAVHESWEPVCRHCSAFNRLEWGVPGQSRQTADKRALALEFMA